MPQAIVYAATAVANFVGDAIFAATGSVVAASFAAQVAYIATEVVIAVAIGAAVAPSMPKPGALQTPIKQAVSPRRSAFGRVRVSGPYALFEANKSISVDVLALLDGKSQGFVQFYLNDDPVDVDAGTGGVWCPSDTRKYAYGGPPGDRTFIYYRTGLDTETSYSQVTAQIASWDSAHRGDGVTSMALICKQSKKEFQQEDFPNGVPQPSAVIDAQLVYDPREETHVQGDKSTYAWSDNPVLCLLAYLTDANGGMGLDYSRHIYPAIDYWIDAANDCDASEATDTGTETRYRCSGTYLHDNAPGDVQRAILDTFDGFMSQRGDGALVLYSGRYYEPTVILTDRHVLSYSVQHYLPDEQAVNEFVVTFTDPNNDFNTADAGTVQDAGDISDRGVIRSANLELSWVPSASQAIRLAKRKLTRTVQPLRGTVTCNLYGMMVLGERYVRLQVTDNAAISDLVVEVSGAPQVDLSNLTVSFPWTAAETTIDSGDPGSDVTPPPTPDPRPISDPLDAPTIDTLTAVYDPSGAGTAGARIQIDITAPVEEDVEWRARWKLSSGSDWHEAGYSDIDDGASVTLITGFVAATGSVDVQVRYLTAAQTSPWSATETIALDAPLADQPYGFAFERDIENITVSKAVRSFDSPLAWTIPAGLVDAQGTIVDSVSVTATAPSADTTFDIQVDGSSVGSMTFVNGSLTATFTKASDTAVSLGHITRIVAPADLHGMAGTLIGSIKGTR